MALLFCTVTFVAIFFDEEVGGYLLFNSMHTSTEVMASEMSELMEMCRIPSVVLTQSPSLP